MLRPPGSTMVSIGLRRAPVVPGFGDLGVEFAFFPRHHSRHGFLRRQICRWRSGRGSGCILVVFDRRVLPSFYGFARSEADRMQRPPGLAHLGAETVIDRVNVELARAGRLGPGLSGLQAAPERSAPGQRCRERRFRWSLSSRLRRPGDDGECGVDLMAFGVHVVDRRAGVVGAADTEQGRASVGIPRSRRPGCRSGPTVATDDGLMRRGRRRPQAGRRTRSSSSPRHDRQTSASWACWRCRSCNRRTKAPDLAGSAMKTDSLRPSICRSISL